MRASLHPPVFSAAWFRRHQRVLLGLLHTPVIGRELRDVLAIRPCDVGFGRRIVHILPHCYTVLNPDGTLTTDFRTHVKYAKRLRHQWMPLWQAAHAWDRFVANPLVPVLNLGFDTLTAYPDPNPGVTSCDGWIRREPPDPAVSWATLIALASGSQAFLGSDNDQYILIGGNAPSDEWTKLRRAFFLFDTSALGASALVSSAVLSLYGTAKGDNRGIAPSVDIYTSSPDSNTTLSADDFDQVGGVSLTGAPIAYADWSTSGYNAFSFNATGRGAISLTGISRFALRNANYDVAATAPVSAFADVDASVSGSYSNQTGTTQDPKLEVTYSEAATGGSRSKQQRGRGRSR